MSTERRSKRKIRVPIKYNDIVCDLTKKMSSKDDEGINNDMSEAKKVGDDGMVVNGDNDESVRQDFNVYDSGFPFLSKNINLDKEDCRNKDLNEENVNEVYCNDLEYNKCRTDHKKETICNNQVDKDCNSKTGMINNLNCYINASSNTITDNDTVQHNGAIINKTFADLVKTNEDNADNKLSQIHMTVEDGREVVIFDEELVLEGSRKWSLTLCGHFVGFKMSYSVLRYNLVRMWDPSIVMDKKDPETLPCWIKLYNVPLEAWTVEGISAIASGLGKPLIMDKTTARLCKEGTGNFGYARVLVEISAKKEFKEGIEICYKSRDMMNLCSKVVKVEYSWKPPKCSLGKVFGHSDSMCGVKQGSQSTEDGKGGGQKVSQVTKLPSTRMEFRPVQRKTNDNNPRQETPQKEKCNDKSMESNNEKSPQSVGSKSSWKVNKEVLKDIRRSANKFAIFEEITDSEVLEIQLQNKKYIVNKFVRNHRQPTLEDSKNWSKEMFKQFKEQWDNLWKSECLDEDDVFDDGNGSAESIVDIELKGKAKDLLYKGSPIASCEKGYRIIVGWNEEDVNVMLIHSCSQAILCLILQLPETTTIGTITSQDTRIIQAGVLVSRLQKTKTSASEQWKRLVDIQLQNKKDIVNKFVRNHRQPTLEDSKNWSKEMFKQFKEQWDNLWKSECLDEDDVFDDGNGSAESIVNNELKGKAKDLLYKGSPIASCENGYRIIVGWNEEDVNVMVIHSCSQAILCLVEILDSKQKKFCSFVYEVNSAPFLNTEDHSEGGSCKTNDMSYFQECIEHIEVEDLNCSGIYFTWVQSRQDPSSGIIKKIDRVLGNVNFMSIFINLHAIFLPPLTSDHSPTLLVIPKVKKRKSRACKSKIEAISNENGERFEETVSKEDVEFMIRSVSDEEVKAALFDICDNKAPRPDGYTAKFYKKAWPTAGSDVCNAIKEFFKNRRMLGEVNSTLITLVPKSNTPQRVSDYIPIACCNALYKIISKILTNRIKKALCKLVNQSQSAFISGRQITDNILLAQEILRGYNRKSGARRVADVLSCRVNLLITKFYIYI
ncbi:RNA-directed DNA polymerase, eukaryota, reverse transcriptase zinc-binding domain protein [Tanacetum coccineum]